MNHNHPESSTKLSTHTSKTAHCYTSVKFLEALAVFLSTENSRIIRIGILFEKVNILRNQLIPHFENSTTEKTEPKTKFPSSHIEENEATDLSQSDKSNDSSNETTDLSQSDKSSDPSNESASCE